MLLSSCFMAVWGGNFAPADVGKVSLFKRLCCKKSKRNVTGVKHPFLLSLGCHSEQGGDERHLAENISFASSSHLSFPYHVHRLISLRGSPCRLERKKAHRGFGQTLDEAMILLNSVVEVLHLPQFTAFRDDPFGFEFLKGLWIGGIFVHVDHPRSHRMSSSEHFMEKPLGRFGISCCTQPEIKRVSC